MTTAQEDFKIRFAKTLQHIEQEGSKDQETMWLLGSLAADLADTTGQTSWSAAKATMAPQASQALLKTIVAEGNEHQAGGRLKAAYAIQALGASLIVSTQRSDPHMVTGEQLLDALIDRAVAVYRTSKAATVN
ncbi:hypothetical protein WH87_11820 [Devosia epidermidihirudinis]|uniref:Uncharacterized protein n=1 Tax=Devosia epidermidihirudinis TaxID=1293439 RepID=A0A0F5Q921_9HYPH|nr:hypothetical protein [Devosia epidermidihirudinis]KKC37248.1 hypothetical protein WH87_11820 [Devosia epidermidihirudinis]